MTVLMWAASKGKTQMCIQMISKFGACPRAVNDQHKVARNIAQTCGHLATADALSKLAINLLKSEPQLTFSLQAAQQALATSLSRHLQLQASGGAQHLRHNDWQLFTGEEASSVPNCLSSASTRPDLLLCSESARVAIVIVVAGRWGPEVLPLDASRIAEHRLLVDSLATAGWDATLHVTEVGPKATSLSRTLQFLVKTLGYSHHQAEALVFQMQTALLWQ